uniref:Uncharacterized protein n=1 Tax=Wuchereria bancrofti TaxID=6293 RepID=A0AAF5PQL4_WUCBA
MRKSIGRKLLWQKELITLMVEIEGILNTRPLTYVSFDDYVVIRPIDFISPNAPLVTQINAIIEMPNGRLLHRPVNMLYPLEVEDNKIDQQPTSEASNQNSEPEEPIARRTRRGSLLLYDGKGFLSDLKDTNHCSTQSGKCVLESSIVLWNNTQVTSNCLYKRIGKYNGQIYEEHVIIDELQTSFTFMGNEKIKNTTCNFSNPHLMNGDIIIDEGVDQWQSKNAMNFDSKDQLIMKELDDEEENKSSKFDPVNIKFRYIFDVVNLQFKQQLVETQRRSCENRNNLLLLIEWLSTSNLTASLILQRSDIIAKKLDNKLLIAPCNVNKSEWKEIEFTGGIVSKFEIERINAELEILAQKHEIINLKTDLLRTESLWTELDQQGEELIEQLTEQFEKTTETIKEKLVTIIAHWKLISISVFSSVILIIVIIVELKFKLITLIFHFLSVKKPIRRKLISKKLVQIPLMERGIHQSYNQPITLSYVPIIHSLNPSNLLAPECRERRES